MQNNIINIATNLGSINGSNKPFSTSLNTNDFNKLSFSKEGQDLQNGMRNTVVPVKPIPQRFNGSKLDLLSNACKMTDYTKLFPLSQKSDENMKKREDKALDKNLHSILSNSEFPFSNMKSANGMDSMKDTLAALLNLSKDSNGRIMGSRSNGNSYHSVEDRRSSSEMEDNSKQKTPTKLKQKRFITNDAFRASNEKGLKESTFSAKKQKYLSNKSPKKSNSKADKNLDGIRVSRVKKRVEEGTKTTLFLDSEPNSKNEFSVSFDIPNRNVFDSFQAPLNLLNLNNHFGITSSIDTITLKIKELINQKYGQRLVEQKDSRCYSNSEEQSINSVPVLFASNLR